MGTPVDAIDIAALCARLETAADGTAPFLLSTVNVNFLVTAQSDEEFRQSLLLSDLCTADGMPIVWMCRLLGIPIKERIAGANIFEAIKSTLVPSQRLKVFLFGGAEGVGAAACKKLNSELAGLTCVGSYNPGFGSIDDMSTDAILDYINSSNADFFIAALGAKRGQAWLLQNHDRLRIPARAHFGAVINLQAGAVKRAPARMQRLGLEWLWRIKEEPQLWRRYWHDGWVLLRLLLTRILPLAIANRWYRFKSWRQPQDLQIKISQNHNFVMIGLSGDAIGRQVEPAIACFRETLTARTQAVVFNLSGTRVMDARFFGLLLMVRKHLQGQGAKLTFVGVTPAIQRMFRLNELDFLLSGG